VVVEQSQSYVELENMIQKWQWQSHVQRRVTIVLAMTKDQQVGVVW
jgi:hypothetical protein